MNSITKDFIYVLKYYNIKYRIGLSEQIRINNTELLFMDWLRFPISPLEDLKYVFLKDYKVKHE